MSHEVIIPSSPGWFLCVPMFDQNNDIVQMNEIEIVAWFIEYSDNNKGIPSSSAEPITICGIGIDDVDMVIYRSPTGEYKNIDIIGEAYVNRDHALTEMKKVVRRIHETV